MNPLLRKIGMHVVKYILETTGRVPDIGHGHRTGPGPGPGPVPSGGVVVVWWSV